MKKITSKSWMILLLAAFVSETGFAKVPLSWIQDSPKNGGGTGGSAVGFTTFGNPEEDLGTAQDFQALFGVSDSMINSETKKQTTPLSRKVPWYLQSMKAELGIELSGEIGVVGISGEAAVELIWSRTPRAVKKLQSQWLKEFAVFSSAVSPPAPASANPVVSESPKDLILDPSMSRSQIVAQVDGVVQSVGRSRKVKDLNRFRSELLERALALQGWAGEFENVPSDLPWQPYKFQIELYVKADGMVTPGVEVGGVLRLRLEWNLKNSPKTYASEGSGAEKSTPTSKFMQSLSEDLGSISFLSDSPYYALVGVKVGVGVEIKGDIGIADVKGSVMGSVFMKPNPQAIRPLSLQDAPEDPGFYGVPREKFRYGLVKAADIAQFMTAEAEKHERKEELANAEREFQLSFIEIELQVSVNGGVVLATVGKKGFLELFFEKRGAGKL